MDKGIVILMVLGYGIVRSKFTFQKEASEELLFYHSLEPKLLYENKLIIRYLCLSHMKKNVVVYFKIILNVLFSHYYIRVHKTQSLKWQKWLK